MHFNGLQLDHQFPRRSSMSGQLNLVSPPQSPPLNTLLIKAHKNVPAPPSPVLNPAPSHLPLIPPAFRFPPPPPQALPLHATNLHSPPAPFISSANVFCTSINSTTTTTKEFSAPNFDPITHAPPAPPYPNVWRFPAAVPSNSELLVRISANLYTVHLAPLINPYITASLRSSHVKAALGAQIYITSDFMQANPFSSTTGTAPTFVTLIIPPTYGATVPNPLCWGGPSHPTTSALSLDSADLIKHLADAITRKKNDPLTERKLSQYNGDPLQWH